MVYGIVRARRFGGGNRKQLENTTDTYSSPSNPSYSYDKLNECADISRKKIIHCRDAF